MIKIENRSREIVPQPELLAIGNIDSLHFFPLKSGRGITTAALAIREMGPWMDREVMLVRKGEKESQRENRLLATIVPMLVDGKIILTADNMEDLLLPEGDPSITLSSELWSSTVTLMDMGDEALQWICEALGIPEEERGEYRLGRRSDEYPRKLSQSWIHKPEGEVTLADGYPILLTSQNSLDDFNKQTGKSWPIDRFRANIVVSGFEPWAEDAWEVVQIGEVIFDVVKPCARCAIPGIDQETGERTDKKEPLASLAKLRGAQQVAESAGTDEFLELKGGFFGWNLVPRNSGVITTSDQVKVLKVRSKRENSS